MTEIRTTLTVKPNHRHTDEQLLALAQTAANREAGSVVKDLQKTTTRAQPDGTTTIYYKGTGPTKAAPQAKTPTPKPKEGTWPHPAPASPHTSASDAPSSHATGEPA